MELRRQPRWHRRRWAPWAVLGFQATAGACAAGLVAALRTVVSHHANPWVCAAGAWCGPEVAVSALGATVVYFAASVVTAAGVGASELAGPDPLAARLTAAFTGPPGLALMLLGLVL